MLLSSLKTGQKAVIVKVMGHGAFRKRVTEMGFVKGKTILCVLNAPLKDPIKYRILDFDLSLRRIDAQKIEIISQQEAQETLTNTPISTIESDIEQKMHSLAEKQAKIINIALVGNPNCGKTSLFNLSTNLHERVGNYSGVTVDEKLGVMHYKDYTFNIVDLPGTYSLSAYSPEELYVRKHIMDSKPDIILNVVDSTNLERNLYLTTQIIDMDISMVMALNMYDEFTRLGDKLDYEQLSTMLGVPIVPTSAKMGKGLNELFDTIISVYNGNNPISHHIHINHGTIIEKCISLLRKSLYQHGFSDQMSTRFLSIKLLEDDSQMQEFIFKNDPDKDIIALRDKLKDKYQKEFDQDLQTAITDAKYGYIHGALQEVYIPNKKQDKHIVSQNIDSIVTNKYFGYPIFISLMFITFFCTFYIGSFPMNWLDNLFVLIGELFNTILPEGIIKDMVVNGIIAGVGSVIVFLPNILILYAFISFMEDSGYMARAAFIMDKIMHKMGLHGKSFIPMIMGFGCSVPAIMATRTIEDRKSRLITQLIIPFMSCSAKIPTYVIIISAFFSSYSALILMFLYMFGICIAVIMAKLLSKFIVKGQSTPFVMELPPYRMPSAQNVIIHTWEKCKQYLKKMGTVILLASVIIWALGYFPNHNNYNNSKDQLEHSFLGYIGKTIEPVLAPCGFSWKESVALASGISAKEIVASSMGVLYSSNDNGDSKGQLHIAEKIKQNISPLTGLSMLIFILLYMPCVSSIAAIRSESTKSRWAIFTAIYTICLAWIFSTIVYQIGSIFI